MSAPRSIVALLGLVIVLGAVGAVAARRTDPATLSSSAEPRRSGPLPIEAGSAPEVDAAGWLNTPGGDRVAVTGKVVLYEFWTFGCSNCRAVLPYVKAWNDRYADDGLVVLSVHTPEFDHEADPVAVADFVRDEGIEYPVALDPDRTVWQAFDNHYWPAFYLHDAEGRRRLTHFGEGSYDETEDAIRQLLGIDADAPRAEAV